MSITDLFLGRDREAPLIGKTYIVASLIATCAAHNSPSSVAPLHKLPYGALLAYVTANKSFNLSELLVLIMKYFLGSESLTLMFEQLEPSLVTPPMEGSCLAGGISLHSSMDVCVILHSFELARWTITLIQV